VFRLITLPLKKAAMDNVHEWRLHWEPGELVFDLTV
jgi:hypothetical protein